MKIVLRSTEITVTAKGIYNEKRNNKQDVMSFLNELSIVYNEAARWNKENGYDAFFEEYKEKANILYKACADLGAYK